ncbi:MAG: hypothetical protein BJ554DRAFT_6905, partial [Olpidium bornovanus]
MSLSTDGCVKFWDSTRFTPVRLPPPPPFPPLRPRPHNASPFCCPAAYSRRTPVSAAAEKSDVLPISRRLPVAPTARHRVPVPHERDRRDRNERETKSLLRGLAGTRLRGRPAGRHCRARLADGSRFHVHRHVPRSHHIQRRVHSSVRRKRNETFCG